MVFCFDNPNSVIQPNTTEIPTVFQARQGGNTASYGAKLEVTLALGKAPACSNLGKPYGTYGWVHMHPYSWIKPGGDMLKHVPLMPNPPPSDLCTIATLFPPQNCQRGGGEHISALAGVFHCISRTQHVSA